MGGTTELWLNVTYNYGFIFRKANVLGSEGIQVLANKTGAESIILIDRLRVLPLRLAVCLLDMKMLKQAISQWQMLLNHSP